MAKARSRRTMRNRKSRNRRGGLPYSPIVEKFKNDVNALIVFNDFIDNKGETAYSFSEQTYTSNFQKYMNFGENYHLMKKC